MTRAAGLILIAFGALLALPEIFTLLPDQRMVVAGLILALVGGLLIADHETEIDHGHG